MALRIAHRVRLFAPHAHLVEVETEVRSVEPLPATLTAFMPVWTPGSYLVREYARHVEGFEAWSDSGAVVARKTEKHAWTLETKGATSVRFRYRIYCNELTVRTNHVDARHAYLNGAPTFFFIRGEEQAHATVTLELPESWRVATALAPAPAGMAAGGALGIAGGMAAGSDAAPPAEGHVLHSFTASGIDELVDCPIEAGTHAYLPFEVWGVPHALCVEPKEAISDGDAARLVADTIAMLETEARLFGELPYDRYLIQLHLSHRGRGGLEHMSSTTLLASPTAFHTRDAYLDLLSLVAHEVFHAWSVKRIRPSGLWPYAYERENYTRLLWWFEGGTSYYDWRILRLSGRATLTEYLAHLADEIAYLDHTPGRLVHSLEEASFDAWIKLYRPDENSPNSSVSYYRKGEVVCALLDIEIRHRSGGRASLDEVMRHLWTAYGKPGRPVPEEGMQALFEEVTGVSLGDLFGGWIRGTEDLPYERVLALAGLRLDRTSRADAPPVSLGARLRSEGGRIFVANVQRDAAAQRAGIDPGDELIAIDGRRVESTSLDGLFAGRSPGDSADVVVARDGRLLTRSVALDPPRRDKVKIVPLADATPEQRALCTHWLRETPPAWTSVGAG